MLFAEVRGFAVIALSNPLVQKLSSFVNLTSDEERAIELWCETPISYPARKAFIREGERPNNICIVLEGWAYRYCDLRNGKRQVVGFLLPGDLGDARAFMLRAADHNLAMLGPATIASVTREDFLQTVHRFPRLAEALWWSTLVDEGTARRWLLNIGQREALTRVAHLFCELWCRAEAVGLVQHDQLTMPLTQTDLGDAVGLTSVHTNRTLKLLRNEGLATFIGKQLVISNIARLKEFASFDDAYLQLERRAVHR